MSFVFGKGSEREAIGVDKSLIRVTRRALEISEVDFSIHDGMRTRAEQQELVARGASWTMKSKHLIGKAVDLVPYVNGKLRWEWPLCFAVAEAMLTASVELDIEVTWGGIWNKNLLEVSQTRRWWWPESTNQLLHTEQNRYVREFQKKEGRSPHLDGPHFQIR